MMASIARRTRARVNRRYTAPASLTTVNAMADAASSPASPSGVTTDQANTPMAMPAAHAIPAPANAAAELSTGRVVQVQISITTTPEAIRVAGAIRTADRTVSLIAARDVEEVAELLAGWSASREPTAFAATSGTAT